MPHQPQRAAGRRGRARRVPAVRGHRALAGPAPRARPRGSRRLLTRGTGAAAQGAGRDGTGRDRAAVPGSGGRWRCAGTANSAGAAGGGGGRRASAVRRHAVGSEKAPFGWEQMAGWGADRV